MSPAVATVASGPELVKEPIPEDCSVLSVHCGKTPSLTADSQGRLWVVFEQEGHVAVAASSGTDLGRRWSPGVRVTPEPERVETNGENRPKIAFGPEGTLHVSWTRKLPGRFTGEVRYSRSIDGGASFETPRTINDDGLPIGHRFDSLHVDSQGHVVLAWIDKRDREAARAAETPFRGASIYAAVSTDRGARFAPNQVVAPHACECCRIAIAEAPGGGAAIVWRHIFEPSIRDHAFAVVRPGQVPTPMRRATVEGWHLEGCPHHGPSMVRRAAGGYHLAWFTAADERPRLLVGILGLDEGPAQNVTEIATGAAASHPAILETANRVWVVWRQSDGTSSEVLLRYRAVGTTEWSAPQTVATVDGPADHPALLAVDGVALLAWHSPEQGLQVIPLLGG